MNELTKENYWDLLRDRSKSFEISMDPLTRKRTGSYYTDLALTDKMMRDLISNLLAEKKDLTKLTFLEPCVGNGNFVFSYLKAISKHYSDKDSVLKIINNIYVCDINKDALHVFRKTMIEFCDVFFNLELQNDYFSSHVSNALLFDVSNPDMDYIPLERNFPELIKDGGADIVVTNPPFKNFKVEKPHYIDPNEYEKDQVKYEKAKKLVKSRFLYSVSGSLNYYKIFTEEILTNYSKEDGYVCLVLPTSLLTDKTCLELRKFIINNFRINSIDIAPENSGFIQAQQSVAAIQLKNNPCIGSYKTKITTDCSNPAIQPAFVDIIANQVRDPNHSILVLNESEYSLLQQLEQLPKIKEISFIENLRGELDLTINKEFITNNGTDFQLIRGRNLQKYNLRQISDAEFVDPYFLEISKKARYSSQKRIACQQIVNMQKTDRVSFCLIPENYILGNSCNFISVAENQKGLDIYNLMGLLNSEIINWYFKLFSSNNHINNYEIDNFPIPLDAPNLNQISDLVKQYLEKPSSDLLSLITKETNYAYGTFFPDPISETSTNLGLDEPINTKSTPTTIDYLFQALKRYLPDLKVEDCQKIISSEIDLTTYLIKSKIDIPATKHSIIEGIIHKYSCLYTNTILNHTDFKLSDLDLEMVRSVPQGGSWKNIPGETVKKSKRLLRITQTGGRTTLYGRINYSEPSYTITTYFNRPGNGTYIHPIHNRVISVREACRLQSFPDEYFIWGNKKQTLTQVGNALPPLLAYQIGKQILKVTGFEKTVDLFSGAGGMTLGFKQAGMTSVIANDIEPSACITLSINNPEIPIICGDITQDSVKQEIIERALEGKADIICGGPPCQGFSMAGFRADNDPRNELFRDFVDIVKKVNPKIIVFENVEGILSYKKGETYYEIQELFKSLNYNCEGRILNASNYGVPQKRKRVILICTKDDLPYKPGDLFPEEITDEEQLKISAYEAIGDLETIPCSENATYDLSRSTEPNDYCQYIKGRISADQFYNKLKLKKSKDSFQLKLF